MVYEIPVENLPKLQKKLASIESKCEKYGLDFHCTYGEKYMKELSRPTDDSVWGKTEYVPCIALDVEGTAIINGYEFLASIDHREHGNLIKTINDEKLDPKWRTAEPKCEHCGTNHTRHNTYLVRNIETGDIVQLGKSCLKLYTNGLSAENVAFYESFLKMIEEYDADSLDPDHMPKGVDPYYDVKPVVAYAIEAVEKHGYHKTSEEHPTKNLVLANLTNDKYKLDDRYLAMADIEIEYVKNMKETSDYIYNLHTLLADGYMKDKDMGFICSIPSLYNRETAKEAERKAREEVKAKENAVSDWMGEVGDKMTATIVSFEVMASFNNAYGSVDLVKMVTEDGNQLKWTTGSLPWVGQEAKRNKEDDGWIPSGIYVELKDILPCKIQFTVKSHDEYKGTKQTTVLRVKPVKCEIEKKYDKVYWTKSNWDGTTEDIELLLKK